MSGHDGEMTAYQRPGNATPPTGAPQPTSCGYEGDTAAVVIEGRTHERHRYLAKTNRSEPAARALMWPHWGGHIVVRDSKDPGGPVLRFTSAWAALIAGIEAGRERRF